MTETHHKHNVVKVNSTYFLIPPPTCWTAPPLPPLPAHVSRTLVSRNLPLNHPGVGGGGPRRRGGGQWVGGLRGGLKEGPGAFPGGGRGGLESAWFPLDWRAAAAGIPAVTRHLFKPGGPSGASASILIHFNAEEVEEGGSWGGGQLTPWIIFNDGADRPLGRARASSHRCSGHDTEGLSHGARMQRWRRACLFFPLFPHSLEDSSLFPKAFVIAVTTEEKALFLFPQRCQRTFQTRPDAADGPFFEEVRSGPTSCVMS